MTQYSAHMILNIMPENHATAYYGRKKMRDFNAFLASQSVSQSVSHIIQNVDKFSFPFPLGDDIKNWVILILDFQVPHSTEDTNFGQ